eukprot:gene5169-5537_t
MLAAKKLPVILQSQLNEGLEGISLTTVEGSILCSSFALNARVDEISLAAISTSVWSQYSNGINEPSLQIVKFEDGFYYGITIINKSYLIAAYGRINPGLLRYKLQHLNQYFTKIFEQMK